MFKTIIRFEKYTSKIYAWCKIFIEHIDKIRQKVFRIVDHI